MSEPQTWPVSSGMDCTDLHMCIWRAALDLLTLLRELEGIARVLLSDDTYNEASNRSS